jgi:hypothetical protein
MQTDKTNSSLKNEEKSYDYTTPQCSFTSSIYNIVTDIASFISCRTLYPKDNEDNSNKEIVHKDPEYNTDTASAAAIQDWLNVPNNKN